MKLCKDCKWYQANSLTDNDTNLDGCVRKVKENPNISLVDGVERYGESNDWEYARLERKNGWLDARLMGRCGREGRYFKPIHPMWCQDKIEKESTPTK